MRYRSSLSVAAPEEVVFDFVSDAANGLPDHPPGTTVTKEPEGSIGLGTSFTFERPDGLRYRATLVRFDRPASLAFENVMDGGTSSTACWSFNKSGSDTIATVETDSTFVGPGWLRPLSGILTIAGWPLLLLATRRLEKRYAARMARALTNA